MSYITDRKRYLEIIDEMRKKKISMALFCTASHWNTEAILLACSRFAAKYDIGRIPVGIGITFSYPHMSQAARVTYSGDLQTGFKSIMKHLHLLCGSDDAPYSRVDALPHLDHADPGMDIWALTHGIDYLASIMFDAQHYPFEENVRLTSEYVKEYGSRVMVEGIIDELSVAGNMVGSGNHYIQKVFDYINRTNVDFLVADLGTEQQSNSVGKCEYKKDRAAEMTRVLGKSMLALHGTSCLTSEQMKGLADDGVIRVNMWTRIARESGQYAAEELLKRADRIQHGDFEACESKQYIRDSIEKASAIMEEILYILGYHKLAG